MMMGAMEHDEVRELLQDAAVEPGGLERLMAGDTPIAGAVAGHLAGCPECADELERLRRSVAVIRPVVRAVPPPELRERTLAYVAAVGRPRGPAAATAEAGAAEFEVTPRPVPAAVAEPQPIRGRRTASLRSLAAIAAALIVAVAGTGAIVSASRDGQVREQAAEIEALGDVARWTLRVDGQPDVRRIALASTTGSGGTGTVVLSPSAMEVVVVADALAQPAAGHEYRCWVEVNGARQPIGKMFFGGDLAYWVGPVAQIRNLPANAHFGVSLVDLASGSVGQPVLEGEG
jgi:Anti-sigma-K factor rskA